MKALLLTALSLIFIQVHGTEDPTATLRGVVDLSKTFECVLALNVVFGMQLLKLLILSLMEKRTLWLNFTRLGLSFSFLE